MPPKTQKAGGTGDPVDSVVDKLIARIRERKAAIKSVGDGTYKSNQLFSFTDGNNNVAVNLNTVSDIGVLAKMYAFLLVLNEKYEVVIKEVFGEDAKKYPPFVWHGYQFDTWVHDIKLRISRLRVSEQQAELKSWQTRLESLISPERKRQLEAEELAREIE